MKLLKTFIIIIVLTLDSAFSYSQWYTNNLGDSLYNDGCKATVECIRATYDDLLYILGGMQYAGPLLINGIAKWDGNNWVNLAGGCNYGGAMCAEKYFGNLFIGGSIWEIDYNPNIKDLGIWDGTNWYGPSIGKPNGPVYDFKVFDNKLFIAGNFGHIGTIVFDKIAAYDGTNWLNVGSMGMWAQALEVFNGELYAGGYWGVRKYLGGTSWQDVLGDPNGYVYELKTDTFNNFLYAGGEFLTVADTVASYGAAMWDGFKWNSMGAYLDCAVYEQAMEVYRGDLYAGGCFDTLESGLIVNYIARWDGTKWDSLGKGANNAVATLEVFKDTLYVGGYFTYVNGNQRAYGIAKWFMPDTGCNYIKPRVYALADTFYLSQGNADVQFYNNNAYVNSWQWDFGDTGTDTIQNPVHTYTDTGTYNVSVTVLHNSCIKTATKIITILDNTGIKDINIKEPGFKLYPNPTDNSFTIEAYIAADNNGIIKIYGLKGELLKEFVLKKGGNKTMVHTSGWRKGIYICNLIINGKIIKSEKMVLVR